MPNLTSSNKIKILIVDDEKDILYILKYSLENCGFEVDTCNNSSEAIALARKSIPDIFILDVMMPKLNGFELCERIRSIEIFKQKKILFLTALIDEKHHLKGLNIGADDYLLKPISLKILQAKIDKIKDQILYEPLTQNEILQHGDLCINPNSKIVSFKNETYVLAKKEFALLYLLASKNEQVLSRDTILKTIWGEDVIVTERTIDVHVRKIRKKLGINYIQTLSGIGYKFSCKSINK